ncbi:hypothetical protein D9M68_560480 [compost metagenome]
MKRQETQGQHTADQTLDKVSEKQMAEFLDTTVRALQARRARKQIPEGVWIKKGRQIIYSKKRYDEWLESHWLCHLEWKYSGTPSDYDLLGTEGATAKRSASRLTRKESRRLRSLEIK